MFLENPVYVDKYNLEMCSTAVIGIHQARVMAFVDQTGTITKDVQRSQSSSKK